MSLCFSPVGDAMRGRARKFPALVNCTVIDWFQPWPMDALYNVGAKFLEPIEQLGPQDSPVRQGIMEFLPYSFEAAGVPKDVSFCFGKRFAYTTPKSFLELIKLYTSMVGNKVDALEDQKNRLTNGLEKLHATSEQVAGLEEELKEKAVVVAEKVAAVIPGSDCLSLLPVGEKKATVEEESSKAALDVLDKKDRPTWKGAQKMMNQPEKVPINVKGFKGYIDDGKVWIINIIMYYDVVVQVEPKRNALRDLMKEFDKAMAEKNALMAELIYIPGDTLVACSFASYVGVFTRQYREETVDAFVQYLTKKGVPLGQGLPSDRVSCENGAILCLIIDPQLQGIAAVKGCKRYKYVQQANRLARRMCYLFKYVHAKKVWIKNRESENGLQVTRMGHAKMLNTFEVSLDQGKPVLIENMGEGIDAVIMPVVSRNTIKRGNKKLVKLGDKEITLSNNFKLFMQTKLSNPHYPPEIQAECTIINFTVTEDGLEDQLLFLVVKLERPDLAKKKSELIQQQNEFKVTLAHLEALLLDTELILSLEEAKKSNMHTFYKYSLDAYLMVVTRAVNSVTLRKPKEKKVEEKVEEVPAEEEGGDEASGGEGGAPTSSAHESTPAVLQKQPYTLTEYAPPNYRSYQEEIIELTGKELKLRVDLLCNIITFFVWNYTRRGLLDSDKLTVVSMMAMNILVRAGKITTDEKETLIRCPPDPNPPAMPENARSWLSETQWAQLKTLENMEAFKKGGQLTQNIEQDSLGWKRWYSEEKAENADLPRSARDLNQFQRLFLLRVMRQDRIGAALSQFVIDNLGQDFVEQPPFDMEVSFDESTSITPFFFVLFPGVDPTPMIEALGRKLGKTEANGQLLNISMGQGQEKIALNALNKMAKEGGWIMLQNIHLMQAWLKDLERALEVIEEFAHDDFRCFLTSEPPGAMQGKLWDLIPEPILQRCIKVADEAPSDLKSNLRRAYSKFTQENIDACMKPREFKATLFALCFFHSLISGRIKFGAQGWSKKYPFNDGDLTICGQVLKNYLNNAENLGTEVPWPDLRYIFGEIMYGGHITDPWDRRVNNTYLAVLVTPELLAGGTLAPGFKSPDASKLEYSHYVKYIEERFPPEVPQMFGLHPNAEIGFLTNQGISIFKTIQLLLMLQHRDTVQNGLYFRGSILCRASPCTAAVHPVTRPTVAYMAYVPLAPVAVTRASPATFPVGPVTPAGQPPASIAVWAITNSHTCQWSRRLKDEDYTPFVMVSLQEADRVNGLLDQIRGSLLELELGILADLLLSCSLFTAAAAEAKYEDKQYSDFAEWFEGRKPKVLAMNPLANLPYLIDGDKCICQTNAILHYLGEKYGLNGSTDAQKLLTRELLCEIYDVRNGMIDLSYPSHNVCRDEGEYKAKAESIVASPLFAKFEAVLGFKNNVSGGKWFVLADGPGVADFHIWEMLDQHKMLAERIGAAPILDKFPKCKAFYEAFMAIPTLQKYFASDAYAFDVNFKPANAYFT
ncbi:ODA11 [Symbiodinium natans]|uniref:ODA11 protein n=1 Tax=Symbiodinium natans TaxID=878477 RepID=A0A812QYL3_9DINO|nr:ODA11 [Symbiodinium natans]